MKKSHILKSRMLPSEGGTTFPEFGEKLFCFFVFGYKKTDLDEQKPWVHAYLEVNVDLWKGEVKVAEEEAHRVQGTPE
jgi:hypothetical protein